MVQLVTRSGKGSALTISELDQNFINLSNAIDAADLNNNTVNSQNDSNGLNRLSAVSPQALHRSPNAVTSMFIYDTSKDSDGGAWTTKCEDTSWYNESLSGNWLGHHDSELSARCHNATLSAELIPNNSNFVNLNNWTGHNGSTSTDAVISIVNNSLRVINNINNGAQAEFRSLNIVPGKIYRLSFNVINKTTSGFRVTLGGVTTNLTANGNYTLYISAATNGTLSLSNGATGTISQYVDWNNISLKEVLQFNAKSGDYFQLTSDGKFYRIWKKYRKT